MRLATVGDPHDSIHNITLTLTLTITDLNQGQPPKWIIPMYIVADTMGCVEKCQ